MRKHLPSMFFFTLTVAIVGLPIGVCAAEPAPEEHRRLPHIVFLLADDLGYGDVSCYNDRAKVPTPNLDRLAREGMRFTDAHSPATLDKLGVADNTLVIFTSDNGPETTSVIHLRADYGLDGARPWRGMKRDQWEGGHSIKGVRPKPS